jgi:putative toxin-antitoxin system antitoxin component (TIGR02293 family)
MPKPGEKTVKRIYELSAARLATPKSTDQIKNISQLLYAADRGIPVYTFDAVVEESGYNKEEMAKFLGINVRTIQNKRKEGGEIVKKDAEHLLRLQELFRKGNEVFGGKNEFRQWLEKPAFGLDNRMPRSLIEFISGIDLVQRELTKIEYGDFS